MAVKSIRCFISGRVQGVYFRGSAQQQAQSLTINGWARNLADGRVEVLACGEVNNLKKFKAWLHHGSHFAEVTKVDCQSVEHIECSNRFEVG